MLKVPLCNNNGLTKDFICINELVLTNLLQVEQPNNIQNGITNLVLKDKTNTVDIEVKNVSKYFITTTYIQARA